MKWITNCSEHQAAEYIERLQTGWNGRVVVKGQPKATDFTVEQLKAMGGVGLYEQTPGIPK